jgi:hypothetical protein
MIKGRTHAHQMKRNVIQQKNCIIMQENTIFLAPLLETWET